MKPLFIISWNCSSCFSSCFFFFIKAEISPEHTFTITPCIDLPLKSCFTATGGQGEPGETCSAVTPEEKLLNQAVVVLSCASYRNQALHIFLRPALLALAIVTSSSNNRRKRTSSNVQLLHTRLYITCVFFSSRGGLQQLQLPEKHVLKRVHPLSWSYSAGEGCFGPVRMNPRDVLMSCCFCRTLRRPATCW